MYRICKKFEFSAAHQLKGLPPDHQCSRLHGHNYAVELVLKSDGLDRRGFVIDYGEMKVFKAYLDDELDHRLLEECVPHIGNTTAENLSKHFWEVAAGFWGEDHVDVVRVSETPKTWAEYRP